MALRDLIRKKPAQPAPTQPPRRAIGGSGRANYQGFIQFEELNPDLQGQAGLQVYDRMYRTDPDVRRNAAMVMNPIIQGTWEIEPYGGTNASAEDEQVAQAVEWALQEFLGRGEGLQGHLGEFLPVLVRSGFCPGEQLWGPADYDGKTVLACRKLALRLPRSVYRWPQDPDGELEGIEQFLPNGGSVFLPIDNLVYYRVGSEGDNWEGVSMLRPVYKSWYYKDKIERLDAVGHEREALGIPFVFPPQGADQDQPTLDSVEDAMVRMGKGDNRFVIMPGPEATATTPGWTVRIEGFGGGGGGKGRDVSNALKYHRDGMAAAFIAEFMRLGQSGTGARATGETQQEPFELGVEALAAIPAKQLRATIIRRFVELNFPNATGIPTLKMSKADAATLEALGTFVSTLTQAGALHPDDQLEDHLRERADLTPADPEARRERQAMEQQDRELQVKGQQKALEAPSPAPGQKPPAKQTATVTREGETFTFSYAVDSDRFNWVEEQGGLPHKIHDLVDDLKADGHDESSAVAIAVEAAKRFCAKGKADWCAAVREWEDKLARARAKHSAGYGEFSIFARQDRALRGFEQLMSLDHIETSIDEARARFEAAGGDAARRLAAAIATSVDRGPSDDVIYSEAPDDLVRALAHELGVLYLIGRQTVADELSRQRPGTTYSVPSTYARGKEPSTVRDRALLAARAIATRIYQAVTRLHLTGRKSVADLQRVGETEARAGLRAEAQLHAAAALNEGRDAEAQDHADEIVGSRYTSILDSNRCDHCAYADDDVLRPLTDPVRLAHKPPNPDCYGGGRCRCMEFFQLEGEGAPSA